MLSKVFSLGKNDRRSDVTGFGCKNGSKTFKALMMFDMMLAYDIDKGISTCKMYTSEF